MRTLVDNEYMELGVVFHEGHPFLHLNVRKWSHNLLKKVFYPTWLKVLQQMKEEGNKAVFACISADDKKILKFHSIMGMEEIFRNEHYLITRRML